MSLPATRFALPHVGAAGDQGPHFAACADPQVRGVFRRRQLEQRPVRSHDVYGIQRRDFPTLSQAVAAPTNTRPAHDPCTRQCSLSSRQTPGAIPASLCQTAAAAVPAALQSATHNRYFATLPDVLKAVSACFDRWRRANNVLRRLCCIT